jgi:hypothetical protein
MASIGLMPAALSTGIIQNLRNRWQLSLSETDHSNCFNIVNFPNYFLDFQQNKKISTDFNIILYIILNIMRGKQSFPPFLIEIKYYEFKTLIPL